MNRRARRPSPPAAGRRSVRQCSPADYTKRTHFFVPVAILRLDCLVDLLGGGVEPPAPRLGVQGLLKLLADLGGVDKADQFVIFVVILGRPTSLRNSRKVYGSSSSWFRSFFEIQSRILLMSSVDARAGSSGSGSGLSKSFSSSELKQKIK